MLPDVEAEERRPAPSMSGLSWLAVEPTARPVPSQTSQAQPLPKRVTPALRELLLERVEAAEGRVDRAASEPPWARRRRSGAMIVQKSEWLAWPPPLLRTAVRIASGTIVEVGEDRLDRGVRPRPVPVERLVGVVDVGLVVLVVVDLHRARVDVRLERVEVVRKFGKREGHARLLLLVSTGSQRDVAT